MIDWLDDAGFPDFPPTRCALDEPAGLLAAGGGMSPLWLDQAYRRGIFPWHDPEDVRLWWSPMPRAVITPDSFHLPRSVRKLLNKPYRLSVNLAFQRVMEHCSAPRSDDNGTWISSAMIAAYTRLHHAGRAISVEYWNASGELSGGFYGVLIGRAFFGESMFSREPNASKIAFGRAAPCLFQHGIQLIDCQMKTDHLARFGLLELERPTFEQRLQQAVQAPPIAPLPGWLL